MNVGKLGYYILLVGIGILVVLGLGALIVGVVCAIAWYYENAGFFVGTLFATFVAAMVLFISGLLVMLWAEK